MPSTALRHWHVACRQTPDARARQAPIAYRAGPPLRFVSVERATVRPASLVRPGVVVMR